MRKFIIYTLCSISLCFGYFISSAQNASVTYDCKTQTLTIKNNWDKCCKIISSTDDMPKALQNEIKKENGLDSRKARPIPGISFEEIRQYIAIHNTIKIAFYYDSDSTLEDIKIEIINESESKTDTALTPAPPEANESPFYKTTPFFIIAAVALFMGILCLLLHKRKKGKDINQEESNNVIQVIEEEKNNYAVGLEYIHLHANNYFTLNIEAFHRDTAVKNVYISREVIKKINSYFKEFLENPERTNETGCYLIGGWETVNGNTEEYNISIEEMVIPGDDAVYDEFSLSFGLKIGIKLGSSIRNLCEKTGRDYVQTAWMHSHPGLGLFLSSHDLIVQKQLTYEDAPKRMIALVIDTNTPDWQMAVFSSKHNGLMNNKEDLLQTISFDILNDWSRHNPVVNIPVPIPIDNTYIVRSEDKKKQFAFSGKAINQLDDLSFLDNKNETYYFQGEFMIDGTQCIHKIESCEIDQNENSVGGLSFAKENDNRTDKQIYQEQMNNLEFGIVYHSEDEMSLLFKENGNEFHTIKTSLKEMKEWTRRKRI